MDSNLAYMYVMMDEARGRLIFNREKLQEYGKNVQLFQGVEDWFDRLNEYGCQRGITVEHYIISSGLKEMIEGTETYRNDSKFTFHKRADGLIYFFTHFIENNTLYQMFSVITKKT